MNKKTKALLNENNAYDEKYLSESCRNVMTDIVCYLRGSNLSEYHQETVRRDIHYMLVDGESRGETPEVIIGGDYQQFCDEIIKSFPEPTWSEKLRREVHETTLSFSIIAFIWLVGKLVEAVIKNTSLFQLSLTLGELIGGLIIVIAVKVIMNDLTRNVFLKSHASDNKYKNGFFLWAKLTVLLTTPILCTVFLKSPSISIHLPVVVGIIIMLLVVGFVLDNTISESENTPQ